MMSIRVKLLGAFLLVALLVPLLGSIAVNRVDSVNGNVEELTRDAVPKLLLVKYLDEVQREQELAVLSYLSSGKVEERRNRHAVPADPRRRLRFHVPDFVHVGRRRWTYLGWSLRVEALAGYRRVA